MRIVIDLQGAQNDSRFRGIGRYTLSLVKGILERNTEHEIFLALNGVFADTIEPIRSMFEGLIPQTNIRVWTSMSAVSHCNRKNDWRRRAAEIVREAFLLSLNPDIVLISSLFEGAGDNVVTSIGRFTNKIPTAVILYDLIPLLNVTDYLGNAPLVRWYTEKLEYLSAASLCLSISEASKQEAIRHLRLPESRICCISTAADERFGKRTIDQCTRRQILERWNIHRDFVMYSGASDARKNHVRLINSYARLPATMRRAHQLLLTGMMPEAHVAALKSHAESVGLAADELVITGYVDDEVLIAFYNLCKCFVFPTWHEGFGLPALEAMTCGAAVIGSNTSSVPEVIGNAEALFDPLDESSITKKLTRVLADHEFRDALREHGLIQARKFSWRTTAMRAIGAFDLFAKAVEGAKLPGGRPNQAFNADELVAKMLASISDVEGINVDRRSLKALANCIGRSFPGSGSVHELIFRICQVVQCNTGIKLQNMTWYMFQSFRTFMRTRN